MDTDLLQITTITENFTKTALHLKNSVVGYLPNFIGALLVLIIGLILALGFKYIGVKLGQLVFKLLKLVERKFKIKGYRNESRFSKSGGILLYWIVLIYFIFFALKVLNIPGITAWIVKFTNFIPSLIGAVAIIYIGFVLGSVARNLIYARKDDKGHDPYFLAQTVRFGIIALFIIWGVDQLGINIHFLTNILNIIVAMLFGAAALGFGIGSSGYVANLIASHHIKASFEVGETISVDGVTGTIVAITHSSIVMQTPDKIVYIPAKKTLDLICEKSV